MSISQEEFESVVQAVAKSRGWEVTVSGFEVLVPTKSRSGRSHYTLRAWYDPESDTWTGENNYGGTLLPILVNEIARAMRQRSA